MLKWSDEILFIVNWKIGQRQPTPNGYYANRDASSPLQNDGDYKYGRFDASALHIAHAIKQTEVQKAYNKRREKPIDYYLVSIWDSLLYIYSKLLCVYAVWCIYYFTSSTLFWFCD